MDRNSVVRYKPTPKPVVALRKESVDRNVFLLLAVFVIDKSLSARRAWIEMYYGDDLTFSDGGRSPQGERG